MDAVLTLYHHTGTRSVRPLWLCYELDVPVRLETPSADSTGWRAVSPAGKVPVLTDGDVTLFESGAIVEHVLDRYGRGRL